MFKSLDELLAREKVIGFQDAREVEVARKLVEKIGSKKVQIRFNYGISTISAFDYETWKSLVEDGEQFYVFVTNLTKDEDELSLDSIKPVLFPLDQQTYRPMIVFNVS